MLNHFTNRSIEFKDVKYQNEIFLLKVKSIFHFHVLLTSNASQVGG